MPTTATLVGYVASGLVLLDWLPPVLSLNLLLLPLNAVRLMRMSKPAPATGHRRNAPLLLYTQETTPQLQNRPSDLRMRSVDGRRRRDDLNASFTELHT
jgi:hypothetical protein